MNNLTTFENHDDDQENREFAFKAIATNKLRNKIEKPKKPLVLLQSQVEEMKKKLSKHFYKQEFTQCEKIGILHNDLLDFYITKLSSFKNSKRAVKIVERYKKNFLDYPELVKILNKKSVFYLVNTFDWECVELRLKKYPEMLALAVETFFFKGKKPVAMSILKKYNLEPLIENFKIKKSFNGLKGNVEILENKIITGDTFNPVKKSCIDMKELGIKEENIIMIDNFETLVENIEEIKSSKIVKKIFKKNF